MVSHVIISYLFHVLYRDVDDVHDMMDDISEQHEIANEIASAISAPVGFGQDIDEVKHVTALMKVCQNSTMQVGII